jgi:predicted DNA-binding protein (MmcQ/YjbR family)
MALDIESFRNYCLSLDFVWEDCPFGPDHLVFKIHKKMFALCSISDFGSVNLKCDPEQAVELREAYPDQIKAAWHMNKTHWNTVSVCEDVSDELILELIDHSYSLIYNSLPKKLRNELEMG